MAIMAIRSGDEAAFGGVTSQFVRKILKVIRGPRWILSRANLLQGNNIGGMPTDECDHPPKIALAVGANSAMDVPSHDPHASAVVASASGVTLLERGGGTGQSRGLVFGTVHLCKTHKP